MQPPQNEKVNGAGFFGLFLRFGVLGIAQMAGAAISFLTAILITRTGGAATFGQFALAVSVLSYAQLFTTFGTDISGSGETAARPQEIGHLLPAILLIRILLATLSYVAILLLGPIITPSPSARLVLYIVCAGVFASVFYPTWLVQGLENLRLTAITLVGPFAITLVFSLAASVTLPVGWTFALARLAGDVVMAAFLMTWATRFFISIQFAAVVEKARLVVVTSSRIAGSQLVRGLAFLSDMLIVGWFASNAALGHFAAAHRIYLLLTTVSYVYFVVLYPRLAKSAAASPFALSQQIHAALGPSVTGAVAAAVIVAAAAPIAIPLAFGPEFGPSVIPLQLLGLAAAIGFVHRIYGQALLALDRASLFLRLTALATGLGVLMKVSAMAGYGIQGISAAIAASELIMLALASFFARKAMAEARRLAS